MKNIYLGGDIMTRGSNLAREEEYQTITALNLEDVDIYSPVKNKSINDKSNVTVEQNNKLAERIVAADAERMWNADTLVMCPEQHAIGTMCETGIIYGWKYMAQRLKGLTYEEIQEEIQRIEDQDVYYHYFDIRTNDLPEINFRRSFGMNQFLYGLILETSTNGDIQEFSTIAEDLKAKYGTKED